MVLRNVKVLFVLDCKKMPLEYFVYQKRKNAKDIVEQTLQCSYLICSQILLFQVSFEKCMSRLQSEIEVLIGWKILAADPSCIFRKDWFIKTQVLVRLFDFRQWSRIHTAPNTLTHLQVHTRCPAFLPTAPCLALGLPSTAPPWNHY